MSLLLRSLKSIFFWRYSRTTWQYDVLCVLILVFIFLTPKSWFDNGELPLAVGHQTPLTRVYLPLNEGLSGELDRSEIESRVRLLTGKPDATVQGFRPRVDTLGNLVAYEVDIR
jgi:hypothetical protein